jgi:hypothetical protein
MLISVVDEIARTVAKYMVRAMTELWVSYGRAMGEVWLSYG